MKFFIWRAADSNHRARFTSFRISPKLHSILLHICACAFIIAGKIGFSTQNIALIPLSVFSSEPTAMPTFTTRHRSSRQASVSYIISSVTTVFAVRAQVRQPPQTPLVASVAYLVCKKLTRLKSSTADLDSLQTLCMFNGHLKKLCTASCWNQYLLQVEYH